MDYLRPLQTKDLLYGKTDAKRNYYYLISGLRHGPGAKQSAPLLLPELMEQLRLSLHPDDLRPADIPATDNQNLLNLLKEASWNQQA